MNLNSNPTQTDLASMLAECEDSKHHYVMWVGYDGEVHIEPLPDTAAPIAFDFKHGDRMKFRFEAFQQGYEYVGPNAALDNVWVNRVFAALERLWKDNETGYQDVL